MRIVCQLCGEEFMTKDALGNRPKDGKCSVSQPSLYGGHKWMSVKNGGERER